MFNVNKTRSRSLNHRLFRTLFEDVIHKSGKLLLFYEVRWFVKGKALKRFWNLKDNIVQFLEKKVNCLINKFNSFKM